MHSAADLDAAFAAVVEVQARFSTASEDELVADAELIERIGSVVDCWRIAVAAQLEHRSRPTLGEASMAFRAGARDGVELVQHVTRVGHAEAGRRVGLGTALAPAVALNGEPLPGRHPRVADALAAGDIGVEAARIIVNTVKGLRLRVAPEPIDDMVEALVGAAKVADVETLRVAADTWALAIDPDGAEPRERAQRRKRALRIGRTLQDGTTRLTMILTPEDLAFLRELLQSRRRSIRLVRTEPGGDETGEGLNPEWREADQQDDPGTPDPEQHDPRMRVQQDYDTAMGCFRAAAQAEADGVVGTAVLHETVITVTADEVERREGQGWAPGILAGLPMPVIERKACTDQVRLMVTGPRGEPLYLSRVHRLFSAAQKKALVVIAGGRCQFPGCRVPTPYLEAHHVEWYCRDGGETHITNGILLCSYHHHLVHAKDSPIEIRTHDGDLWIVPRSWTGPPDPLHRRQSWPIRDPRLHRFRKRFGRAA